MRVNKERFGRVRPTGAYASGGGGAGAHSGRAAAGTDATGAPHLGHVALASPTQSPQFAHARIS
jgi:hypothetical protein